MKRLIILAVISALFAKAKADGEYPYFTFVTSDGSVTSVALNSYSMAVESENDTKSALKLEVTDDGKLAAISPNGDMLFTLTDLTKMYFSDKDETALIDSIIESKAESTSTEVFTVSGISLGKFSNMNEAKSALNTGIYIFKTNNKQLKISIQ